MSVSITVPDDSEIREEFVFEDPDFGTFRDAVYFPAVTYDDTTPESRQAIKQARYDNWRAQMIETRDTPPPDPLVE